MRLSQATCLSARLLSLPRSCLAARIAEHAASEPNSWLCSTLRELQQLGAPRPRDFGIVSGCQVRVLQPWLRTMKVVLSHRAWETYNSTLEGCNSLHAYACWQPSPHLHTVVYGPHIPARSARMCAVLGSCTLWPSLL